MICKHGSSSEYYEEVILTFFPLEQRTRKRPLRRRLARNDCNLWLRVQDCMVLHFFTQALYCHRFLVSLCQQRCSETPEIVSCIQPTGDPG